MDDLSKHNHDESSLPFGFRRKPLEEQLQEDNWKGVESAIRQLERLPVPVIGMEPEE